MKYGVSIAVIFTTEIEANSPEEAADLTIKEAPYDVECSVPPHVWNEETGEYWDIE